MEIFFWIFMGCGAAIAGGVLYLFVRLRMAGPTEEEPRRGRRSSHVDGGMAADGTGDGGSGGGSD